MKTIQIFKPGTHTPMVGAPIQFTERDLQASVAAYDTAVHEAPLVVGHPEHDAPAYGWVKSLSFADGLLVAEPDEVDAAFAEMVNSKRFKKISASFYTPNSPSNPKPGVYYLRHVGFLGAQAPSVKGLKDASFAAGEEGVVEFSDWGHRSSANLFRRMRDFFIEQFGLEKADAVLPDWEINSLQEEAMRTVEAAPQASSYAEPTPPTNKKEIHVMDKTPEQLAAEAELARRTTVLAAQEAAFAERANAARRTELAAFAESLVTAGRLLPKDQPGMVAFMAALPADGVVEFGEGDGKQSLPGEQFLRTFLAGLPKQVEFAEVGAGDGSENTDNTDANAIAQRAVAFQESELSAGRQISVTAAVQHVTKGAAK